MVKPERIKADDSVPAKVTTEPFLLPSMIVVLTTVALVGCVDRRIIFLPPKFMFSTYLPGETMTSSPSLDASIPPWIVG
jgi:hypothetical protein